jgi:hypothetical protein
MPFILWLALRPLTRRARLTIKNLIRQTEINPGARASLLYRFDRQARKIIFPEYEAVLKSLLSGEISKDR